MSTAEAGIQTVLIGDAMEYAPVGVFVVDDSGRIIAANQYACELLGYTRDELLALRVPDISPQTDVEARLEDLRTGEALAGQVELRRKDGTFVPTHYRAGGAIVGGLEFWVTVCVPDDPA